MVEAASFGGGWADARAGVEWGIESKAGRGLGSRRSWNGKENSPASGSGQGVTGRFFDPGQGHWVGCSILRQGRGLTCSSHAPRPTPHAPRPTPHAPAITSSLSDDIRRGAPGPGLDLRQFIGRSGSGAPGPAGCPGRGGPGRARRTPDRPAASRPGCRCPRGASTRREPPSSPMRMPWRSERLPSTGSV